VGFTLTASSLAFAYTTTTTFQVNAKVISFCLVGDDTALYRTNPLSTTNFDTRQEDSKAVVVTCALGTPYTVIMEKQTASNNKASPPENTANGLALHYPLYASQDIKNIITPGILQNSSEFSDAFNPIPIIPTPKPHPATKSTTHVKVTVNF